MRSAILPALFMAGFAVTVPATAQNITDVQHALSALSHPTKQLAVAAGNLLQMEAAMTGTGEYKFVDQVSAAKLNLDATINEVRTTAQILVHMTCPDDVRYVRSAFRESAEYAAGAVEIDIKEINISLTQLTTPAAVAEAARIRDLMITIRDILKPFAGHEL